MAKLQEDWIFLGLGIGAIYLVYKSTKPVTDVLDTTGDLLESVSGVGQNSAGLFNDSVSYLRDYQKIVGDAWKRGLSNLFGESYSGLQITTKMPDSAASSTLSVANVTSKLSGSSSKSNVLAKSSTSYNLLTRPTTSTPVSDYSIREAAKNDVLSKQTNTSSIIFSAPKAVSTIGSTTKSILFR